MKNNQTQKAGDASHQIQAETIIINNGISEQRARDIFLEMSKATIAENTKEAESIALERIQRLETKCILKIEEVDKVFECFSDPSFQALLKKVQLTAISTERESDYNVLSELLIHRIKNKTNVKKKASISKAVEIIDLIDDDSLLALTVFLAMEQFIPISGNIENGVKVIDNLYSKFDLDSLPKENSWIDNLCILGAITSSSISNLKKYEDYFSEALPGYVCVGIEKNSENHHKAKEMLKSHSLSENLFEDNALIENYIRLSIPNRNSIKKLMINSTINDCGKLVTISKPITKDQIECLEEIFDMYSNDAVLLAKSKDIFYKILDSYPSFCKAKDWWNSIAYGISLTSIGKVIGHTNAKSIDHSLPELD